MKKIMFLFLFLFGITATANFIFAAENERAFESPESRDDLKRFESEEDQNALDFGSAYEEGDYEEEHKEGEIGDY